MLFRTGRNWVNDLFVKRGWLVRRRSLRRQRNAWRLPAAAAVESLEQRVLLSSIVVNSADGGQNYASSVTVGDLNPNTTAVTLRDAIDAANNSGGDNTITFDSSVFPPNATTTITLSGGSLWS
jgi:hypothetical protein